jgi:hypothetical protein
MLGSETAGVDPYVYSSENVHSNYHSKITSELTKM